MNIKNLLRMDLDKLTLEEKVFILKNILSTEHVIVQTEDYDFTADPDLVSYINAENQIIISEGE